MDVIVLGAGVVGTTSAWSQGETAPLLFEILNVVCTELRPIMNRIYAFDDDQSG
jgi:glycine/D-amino acid oxidase-like deaminating enzyme